MTVRMKTLQSFETSICSVIQNYIPEDVNHEQQDCENLRFLRLTMFLYPWHKYIDLMLYTAVGCQV